MIDASAFPTVLVAHFVGPADALVRGLRQEGYLVLSAEDGVEAVEIARVHSRTIQVMLTDDTTEGRLLAVRIGKYRPKIQVVFVSNQVAWDSCDPLKSEPLFAEVRAVLDSTAPPAIRPSPARSHLKSVAVGGRTW